MQRKQDQEIWKEVPGFERYKVSSYGRVIGPRGHVLNPSRPGAAKRYLAITIWTEGRNLQVAVHRMVALAFLGPCPDGMQVCHGPGGSLDNSIGNLSYGTLSTNNGVDKVRDGKDQRGIKSPHHKLTEKDVLTIRSSHLSYGQLAKIYGVSKHCVYRVVKRLSWAWL